MAASPLKETPSQTAGPFVHIGTVPSAAGMMSVRTPPGLVNAISAASPRVAARWASATKSPAVNSRAAVMAWVSGPDRLPTGRAAICAAAAT